MPLNLSQLEALIDAKILTGGRRTIAANLREVLKEIAETADYGGTVAVIDSAPTDGSANAVSSNGTFDALATKLNLSGGTLSGSVNWGGNNITNVGTITSANSIEIDVRSNFGGMFLSARNAASSLLNQLSLFSVSSTNAEATFTDNSAIKKGIMYAGDWSATLEPLSLIHKGYVDALLVGLWDDRGNYDASGNVFPSSGGSGTAGAVLKGDIWTASVAGTLGGVDVEAGDTVRALSDAPGQTASNWAIAQNNIGYVPLNKAGDTMLGNLNMGNHSIIGGNLSISATDNISIEITDPGATLLEIDSNGGNLLLQSSGGGNVDINAIGGGELNISGDTINVTGVEAYFSASAYSELASDDVVGIQAPNAINIGSDGSAVINIGSALTTNVSMSAGDADELSISYVAVTNAGFQYSNSLTGFNAGVVGNSSGVGIIADDSDFYAYLSTSNLGSDETFLFPATGGTLARINNETFTGVTTFASVNSPIIGTTTATSLDIRTGGTNRITIAASGAITVIAGVSFSNSTDSTSTGTGSVVLAGGIGIVKNVHVGGTLTVASDTDATTILGRSRFYSATSDFAMWSHFDRTSASEYSVRTGSAGHTTVNAVTGQTVRIAIQNTNVATFGTSSLDFLVASNFAAALRADTVLQFLDTSYKTALDVSAANTLRIANGFTTLSVPIATTFAGDITLSGSRIIQSTNGSITLRTASVGSNTVTIGSPGGDVTGLGVIMNSSTTVTTSAGTKPIVTMNTTFAPTSGAGNFINIHNIPTVNQTGGANGAITLYDANPVMTSVIGTIYGYRSQLAASPTGGGTAWNIYADGTAPNYFAGKITQDATITASGTTGNQTINKPTGTVNIAAAGTTVTVTNSLVTTSSIIYAVIRTNDATATIKNVVPGAGSFVINLNAATTGETSIGFIVIN